MSCKCKFTQNIWLSDYTLPKNFEYCKIFYNFVSYFNIFIMEKQLNRIKEVLDSHGVKQTWLADKLHKSYCVVNSYKCNRPTTKQ